MNEQKTGREKRADRRGFSAVDAVIVLLVLAAVAGIVYRVVYAARHDRTEDRGGEYTVSFTVAELHQDALAEIRGGDTVYLCDNDIRLGYMAVYEDPESGERRVALTISPIGSDAGPDRAVAEGAMICTDGYYEGGSLLVGNSGVYLTPGSEVEVRTDRVLFTLRITEIRPYP